MKTDKQLQEDVLAVLDWESSVVDADPILTPGLVFGWRQHGGATQSLTGMQRSAAQALQAGQAQLQAAEFSLAESKAALTQSEPTTLHTPQRGWSLHSPVNGQVIKLQLSNATTVSAGQALLEIGDTDAMAAVIDVLSSEARQVAVGTRLCYCPVLRCCAAARRYGLACDADAKRPRTRPTHHPQRPQCRRGVDCQ